MSDPLLFISAGDLSGDNAMARVLAELADRKPGLRTIGLGGEKLKALGQNQLAHGKEIAVIGFWEVAKRYRFFVRLMDRCVQEIERRRPACIVLVDYPGFNLRLAKRVRHLKIPIVYYISPQVWAWGGKRVGEIRSLVDRMLVILPFETEFYRDTGVQAEFVGHYLLEDIPAELIRSPIPRRGQIALLPGSRPQEIERMLDPICRAAARFNQAHHAHAVIAGIRGRYDYEAAVAKYASSGISVSYDDSRQVVGDSDLVVTASGTATLEVGIIGRPMVIVYRTGFLTYHIARRLLKIDTIGLVNLVLGEKVAPELIQQDVTEQRILEELELIHHDPSRTRDMIERLHRIPERLAAPPGSRRAAEIIESYL
ncbi:lipid-A-disaccharide synthase [candidate division GN15 bacterium]|uniref:Lipid-A-disaccharide synthase n=1 Tax=candidate division GN15 bacterium TaxID=2072418 RepID=A0A855WXY4_9BACT|nr:MAG: lipid-A-disaccharide synthase [candidate division GN15 bacterium]